MSKNTRAEDIRAFCKEHGIVLAADDPDHPIWRSGATVTFLPRSMRSRKAGPSEQAGPAEQPEKGPPSEEPAGAESSEKETSDATADSSAE